MIATRFMRFIGIARACGRATIDLLPEHGKGPLNALFRWFESLIEPFPETPATQPPSGLWRFIAYFSRPHWPIFAAIAVGAASYALVELWLFSVLGRLIDALGTHTPATLLAEEGTTLILAACATVMLPVLALLFNMTLHQGLFGNFPAKLRWLFHRYLLEQSAAFYQDEFAGRIATKMMQTAVAVRDAMAKLTDVFVYVGTYLIGILALVISLDPLLAIPFTVWLVLYGLGVRWFLPRFKQVSERQSDARSVLTGRVTDAYAHIHTVKLFAHAQREAAWARRAMEDFREPVDAQMRLATLYEAVFTTLYAALLLSTGALSLWLWHQGDVGAGAVAVCVALVLRLEGMSHWIGWELNHLFENLGTVHDGAKMLARPVQITDPVAPKPLQFQRGDIHFDRISFAYPGQAGVFKDFDLNIRGGEKIGLVGISGAGKSTLVNLLLRLFDLNSGQITLDGQAIHRLAQHELRAQIGVVTQDTALMHRSVYDNIVYGRPEATRDDVLRAARQARALDFIEELQDSAGRTGFDAYVGERGVRLSGGQRQRIAIARVLLKDAPILVLDEATSALDSEVEAAITDSLQQLMHGKTVIAIAHRLSTIAHLDRLVVIDNGSIVEHGSHSALLEQDGLYAKLWQRQSGGFLSESVVDGLALKS